MKPKDVCPKSIGLRQYQGGEIPRVDGMTAVLEGVEPVSGENTNMEDAIRARF
jgi:hypothetical protein